MGIKGFRQKRYFFAINPNILFTFANDKLVRTKQNIESNAL